MEFETDNRIFQLCATGMEMEGAGRTKEAADLFLQAWRESSADIEKFTAAHYVARHQDSIEDKLKWDKLSLNYALNIKNENIKGVLPSLYLNIGKCFEDLGDNVNAKVNYSLALKYSEFLPGDGYGKMILGGIQNGMDRVSADGPTD